LALLARRGAVAIYSLYRNRLGDWWL